MPEDGGPYGGIEAGEINGLGQMFFESGVEAVLDILFMP